MGEIIHENKGQTLFGRRFDVSGVVYSVGVHGRMWE
jgi:hypothetical protein